MHQTRFMTALAVTLAALAGAGLAGCSTETSTDSQGDTGSSVVRYPDPATIPEGPMGDAIRRGEQIVRHTYEELPDNVGNKLHCTSCHLDGGTVAGAAPWVGITGVFPEFRARNSQVNTLETRVNDCFERSMNGTALDPLGQDMSAIIAYMTWLSQNVPVGQEVDGRGFRFIENPPTPNRENGQVIYTERCAVCHGENGEGRFAPDGAYQFPPVWGPDSFNIGAGMARLNTAAAYVRWNMPLNQGGTLTDQEAYDVADYFIHQDRPNWARAAEDWPNGGRTSDARY
jgi:thiosulfate dehydrogenase